MNMGYYADAVCILRRASLSECSVIFEKRVEGLETHLSCGNPSPCPCAPLGDQEAESMAGPQAGACEKRPLFADEPFVIFDVIGVGEEGVKGEKGDSVEVGVPGDGPVQAGTRNFGGPDRDRNPAEGSVEDQSTSGHSHVGPGREH